MGVRQTARQSDRQDETAGRTREQERAALGLWTELTSLTGSVRARLADDLDARAGVLPDEADLLALLQEAPEQRLRMADVSQGLGLSKSGVTRLVDRLAARGLVVRAPCPKDRRVVYAGLTEEGRAAAEAAVPARAAALARLLAGRVPTAELERLTARLRRLTPTDAGP